MIRDDIMAKIDGGRLHFEYHTRDIGKTFSINGDVGTDGKVSVRQVVPNLGNDTMLLSGQANSDELAASGSLGQRSCSIALVRENAAPAGPAPTTPAKTVITKAPPAAAPVPAAVPEPKAVVPAPPLPSVSDSADRLLADLRGEVEKERQNLEEVRRQLAAERAAVAAARGERQRQAAQQQAPTTLDFDPGHYHALVIGNNAYKNLTNLKTAVGDAEAVAKLLGDKYGFDVVLLKDATRYQILDALAKLRATLRLDDNLLVYYAGHGVFDERADAAYWLPVDAGTDNPANWVSNADLTNSLRAMDARHVLIVADSCYSGTLLRGAAMAPHSDGDRRIWLRRMEEKRSRTALTSGGLEPVADGGGSGHSVFSKAFLDALTENVDAIEGQSLLALIRRPVVVNADQTPAYADIRSAGDDGGDFILVPVALRSMAGH